MTKKQIDNKIYHKLLDFETFDIEDKSDKNGKNRRIFNATITTNSLDRHYEVVVPDGIRYNNFLKNRTIFYNHNSSLPVGSVLELIRGKGKWKSKGEIATRTEDNLNSEFFPDFVWNMMSQGHIKGVSIGFKVMGKREPSKQDISKYGDKIRSVITDWELVEYSIAPIQANPEALITSIEKSNLTAETVKSLFPDIIFPEKKDNTEIIKKEIEIKIKNELKKYYKDISVEKDIKDTIKKEIEKYLLRQKGIVYY